MKISILIGIVSAICFSAYCEDKLLTVDWVDKGKVLPGFKISGDFKPDSVLPGVDKKAVKVILSGKEEYPGFAVLFDKPKDCSDFTSLKIELYLESEENIQFSLRVDNEKSTDENYQSRFNLDGRPELNLNSGSSLLRFSMERMINGVVNNAGFDVKSINKVAIFSGKLNKDAVIYIKRIWFEKVPVPASSEFVIADFMKDDGFTKWHASSDEFEVTKEIDSTKGRLCRVKTAFASKKYKMCGIIAKTHEKTDWQVYDKLVISFYNPRKDESLTMGYDIRDNIDKKVNYRFNVRSGDTEVELPLSGAETADLENIIYSFMWFRQEAEEYNIYLKKIYLKKSPGKRVILIDPNNNDKKGLDYWKIDLKNFYDSRGDRLIADLTVAGKNNGEPVIFKCRPLTRKSYNYTIPENIANLCDKKEKCKALGWYINHGETLVFYIDVLPSFVDGVLTLKPAKGLGVY